MPCDNLGDLPDSVRNNLPKHAQEICWGAHNSAKDQYGEKSRSRYPRWSLGEPFALQRSFGRISLS